MTGHLQTKPELGGRILVVDDDAKLCQLLADYLEPLGYEVVMAHTGPEGLKVALQQPFAAVILDILLPGMNGFDVLHNLRAKSDVPVLVLTGVGDETDRITGLDLGADDYLPKTFSTRELLARLRAVMRRSRSEVNPELPAIVVGKLRLDPHARMATLRGRNLHLTTSEFDLLLALAKTAGKVKTREQLQLEVAERDFDVFDRSIDVHISALRKKLHDDPKSPRFIVAVRNVGYMLMKPGTEPSE